MRIVDMKKYILDRVDIKQSGCWEWNRYRDDDGYGRTRIGKNRSQQRAHRISYEAFKESIPEGMVVMHSCDNPCCCNPDHLSVGTQLENIADSRNKRRGGSYWYPGAENPKSILTDDDVRAIRKLRAANMPYSKIAEQVKCGKTLAVLVATGKRWAHVI